jgi:putative tricarboxylic transport membrane protein
MEIINSILIGFYTATTITNLLYCLLGVTIGTLVGVLPGLGPVTAMALLVPFSFSLHDPATAIIFLAGIYYGTQYGGSTTSILLNIPGESSSVVTAIDGYKMALQGRGGSALTIAALSSFFAGTTTVIVIGLIGVPLSNIIFYLGSAEYTVLIFLGLLIASFLTNDNILKGIGMSLIGILLSCIGQDINSGIIRFSFNNINLSDGIAFNLLAMGLFGLGEIFYVLIYQSDTNTIIIKPKDLYPSKEEIKRSIMPTLRGTLIGSFLGILPGGGPIISSFASYFAEKKFSKNSKMLGKGAIEGVAGPEAANNAGAQTSFIPMLSLGLPTTPVMVIMIGTLMMFNIQPGPQLMTNNLDIFWGLLASMWIGNFFLVILNIPLIGMWLKIFVIPIKILYLLIILICVLGAYSLGNGWFDILLLFILSFFGFLFRFLKCEIAPLAMGFILGKMFEEKLRKTLIISRGDWSVFLHRPITLSILIVSVLLIVFIIKSKKSIIKE